MLFVYTLHQHMAQASPRLAGDLGLCAAENMTWWHDSKQHISHLNLIFRIYSQVMGQRVSLDSVYLEIVWFILIGLFCASEQNWNKREQKDGSFQLLMHKLTVETCHHPTPHRPAIFGC